MTMPLFSRAPRSGIYRAELCLDDSCSKILPFNFKLHKNGRDWRMTILNAEEKIEVDEISVNGDSVLIKMPVFDTEFRCRITKQGLEGAWINHYRSTKNILKFRATHGQEYRFEPVSNNISERLFEGRWEVDFSPGTKNASKAVAIFRHVEGTDLLYGTFLTETGDYRYLEGVSKGNELFLSAFDGSHAFLFKAHFEGNELKGTFYSGAHFEETWKARRNNEFELRDPENITIVKDPAMTLSFSFPSLSGKQISLADEKFRNKPVIVQIMGSWCPNCMDESRYLSGIYRKYAPIGLEIIAIAFEKTSDEKKAGEQVKRMKEKIGIPYDVALSLKSGKNEASAVFSNLSEISAFPTTLFLDRQHRIVKVYTGFSGPATGKEFEAFSHRTENLINTLLKQ